MHDHIHDPELWRRTVSAWWLRALLWLLVVLSVAGAALGLWLVPRYLDDERVARAAGPVVADVSGVSCEFHRNFRGGSRDICQVTLTAETSDTTVSTVVQRTGEPELDGPYGAYTTVIYIHPDTGEIWFDDEEPGEDAGWLAACAIGVVGLALVLIVVLRAEMHLASPFIPSTGRAMGVVMTVVTGCILGASFAAYIGWWAVLLPAGGVILAAVVLRRTPVALEVVIGQVVLHRRGGRQSVIRLGADTQTEVSDGQDPVVVLRQGNDRLRVRSSSWAARGALLKELERSLSLSGAPVPQALGVARLRVRGW